MPRAFVARLRRGQRRRPGGGGRRAPAPRQHAQVHPDDPALGAGVEAGGVARSPDGARRLGLGVDQLGALRGGQAQILDAELGDPALTPQPGQRQRRFGPAHEHQAQRGRQVGDEEGDAAVHLGGVGQVVVVDDEGDGRFECGELVEQRRHHVGRGRGAGRAEQLQGAAGEPGHDAVERGDDTTPEPDGVGVGRVDGEPGRRTRLCPGPRRHQRCLAPTRSRDDQGEPAGGRDGAQPVGQGGAGEGVRPRRRCDQLGAQHGASRARTRRVGTVHLRLPSVPRRPAEIVSERPPDGEGSCARGWPRRPGTVRPYSARMLRRVPRPTFGPLAGRRSRARARRAAPAALARLGGPQAVGWRLGEPFEGRGDTNVFAVEAGDCSPALLKATVSRQGRLQLERQVQVLTALHQRSAARSVGAAGAAHPGRR